MSDDDVKFCIFRCKRTRTTEKMDELAEKTMVAAFEQTFDFLREQAEELGVEIPIEFKAKMLKWGAKNNLFPPEEPAKE